MLHVSQFIYIQKRISFITTHDQESMHVHHQQT